MSEIKALDKLRDELEICETTGARPTIAFVSQIADEIQAEVDSRYMLLPFDADGVPIRPGDEVYRPDDGEVRTVCAVGEKGFVAWNSFDGRYYTHSADQWSHVKPRTVEDVLRDFGWECVNNCGADPNDIASCADEIRELLGGAE